MDSRGLSKKRLADESGVHAKTIQRVLKDPAYRPNRTTCERIAKALGMKPEALAKPVADMEREELEAFFAKEGYRTVNVRIPGDVALGFEMVERRYGVTPQEQIELAPLLFELVAGMSLAERRARMDEARKAKEALHAASPAHLDGIGVGLGDIDEALRHEEASIDARDLHGATLPEDQRFDEDSLFVSFLSKLADRVAPDAVDEINESFTGSGKISYAMFGKEIDRIAGGNDRAWFALTHGHALLNSILPELLEADATERRAAWIAGCVPDPIWAEREARSAKIKLLFRGTK